MKRSSRIGVPSGRPWARDAAVESHLPLVKSLVARLRAAYGLGIPFDDLVSAGVVGLLEAAERFEPDRGVAFTTFAYRRIRGAILDTQRHEYGGSAGTRQVDLRLSELVKERPANTNAVPNTDTHARRGRCFGEESAVVQRIPIEDVEGSARTPDEEVDHRRQMHRLRNALVALPSPERLILELHYFDGESFSGIGARMGICKPWAFRLHQRALENLRHALGLDLEREESSGRVTARVPS